MCCNRNLKISKTVILARFLPVIRTFAPIVAGVGDMNLVEFLTFSTIGALLWAVGLPVGGFYLGRIIPDIDKYLLPAILLATVSTFGPPLFHVWRDKRKGKTIES